MVLHCLVAVQHTVILVIHCFVCCRVYSDSGTTIVVYMCLCVSVCVSTMPSKAVMSEMAFRKMLKCPGIIILTKISKLANHTCRHCYRHLIVFLTTDTTVLPPKGHVLVGFK